MQLGISRKAWKLVIAFLILLGLIISSQAMAGVCTVPGTHPSVQAAVSDPSCDPINVGVGMFVETGQIVINRNLTITGAGAGSTVIKPSGDTGSSGNARGWFLVNTGFTLNLSNVTLDGSGRKVWQAIRHRGQGTINDCSFKNIKYEESGPSYAGTAIVAFDAPGNVDVIRCTFEGIGRVGVLYYGSGKAGTFSGNMYTGKGTGDWLDYAVEVGAGASATITNNFITNNLGVASVDGSTSAGILATDYYGPGTSATITNNTITNCTDGVAVGYLLSDATNVTANYNNIYGNTLGINNVSTVVVVNAENNWWGSSSGPYHPTLNPSGTGDSVSDGVDFIPWLPDPVLLPLMYWKDYNGPETPGGYMPDIDQKQDFDKAQVVRTEESDPSISYQGTWTTINDPGASGGSRNYADHPASFTFSFTGSSIKWINTKAWNRGISEVWIDGNLMATVDLYDPNVVNQVVLYSNSSLSNSPHTIQIKSTNTKNPASQGYLTSNDAFDVAAGNPGIESHYCAPVAEANSLWWLDKAYRLGIFEYPEVGEGYVGGDINGDRVADILDLVQELAWFKDTNGQRTGIPHTGTTTEDEQAGIDAFLRKYKLDDKLYEHTIYDDYPEFFADIEKEIERSQDVKLDLGFWHVEEVYLDQQGHWIVVWKRIGGHAVTVAGVDSANFLLAVSDPYHDARESGLVPGVIRPLPNGHPAHPNDPTVHNNEANASHDIYTVVKSISPGGNWALKNYPAWVNLPPGEMKTVMQDWGPGPVPPPVEYCMTFTEIEAAVIVSPIICGNGVVDPGEECDDGNLIPGDGCSPVCKLEVCGNGILDPQEQCDDGNLIPGDGCSPVCKLEVCGNGILDPQEQCDDGNLIPGDGCSPVCKLEVCGNGILDPQEQCDDGNNVSGDGCSAVCVIEFCGDGIIQPGIGETCDPPGPIPGWPNPCRQTCTYCGDNIVNNGEQCDDGNANNGDGCSAICQKEGNISVSPANLNFGQVVVGFTSAAQTVTITNTGAGTLKIDGITITGTHVFEFGKQNDNCSGKTLAPSASCTLQALFSPTSLGSKSANLTISSDDPNTPIVTVPMSGTGIAGKVTVTLPNGGETWKSGKQYTITWSTAGTAQPVALTKVYVSANGGATWKLIKTLSGNPGSYLWTVPTVGTKLTKCRVGVVLLNASVKILATDTSDANFTVQP